MSRIRRAVSCVCRAAAALALAQGAWAPSARAQAPIVPAGEETAGPTRTVSRDAQGRITVLAIRLARPLVLDGRLDEEVYARVLPAGGFIQQEPAEGEPATEPTDTWVFFDRDRIYVSARCWDSQPDREVSQEMRRDHRDIQEGENFTVTFDTFHDRRNGVYFQTNALGGLRDIQVSDERDPNADWNTVWDVRTHRDDRGWTLEMAIPFKSLRYKANGAQDWGINMRRIVRWKNETSYLAPIPASYGNRGVFKFSSSATLVGLDISGQSNNIELKPYVKSGVFTDRTARPRPFSNDLQGDLGFDAKYGLTKGLTADFTVNTDFAQVENDETQVNFGRSSVLYPEKRDFFLEGQGIFAFGGVSARSPGGGGSGNIGQDAAATNLSPIVFFSRQIGLSGGYEVPIRAGSRLTGRAGPYTLGLLDIETGPSAQDGSRATNFSVARLRRDILGRGSVGVIATHRQQRAGGAPGSNQVYGVDTTLAFFQNLRINGYFARSVTPGVSRNDASYLVKVDNSLDRWGANFERLMVGERFNPEIGFLRRSGFARTFAQGRFSPRPAGHPLVRKFVYQASADVLTNPQSRLESSEVTATFRIDFASGDQWQAEVARNYERLERPFSIARSADAAASIAPGEYRFGEYRTTFYVAPQHPVSGRFDLTRGSFYDGTRTEAGFNGRIDLGPRVGLEPRIQYDWVDLPAGRFTTKLVGAHFGVTLTPRIAFTSLVQYSSTSSSLLSNVRFRWEYQPGSDFYVVYSDGRDERPGARTLQSQSLVIKLTRLMRW